MSTAISHPRAPAPQRGFAGVPPRYLIRDDGMVVDYNPVLARNPKFTPSNELPRDHVERIAAAQLRDSAVAAAKIAYGELADEDVRQRGAARQAQLDAIRPDATNTPEGQWKADSHVIANAKDKNALKPFFERAGLKPDLRQPLEALRAIAYEAAKPKAE